MHTHTQAYICFIFYMYVYIYVCIRVLTNAHTHSESGFSGPFFFVQLAPMSTSDDCDVAKSFATGRAASSSNTIHRAIQRASRLLTCRCIPRKEIPLPAPDILLARQEQVDQEARRRYHRCACHPASFFKDPTATGGCQRASIEAVT
jgi:hypothetical protein